ncbi:hypothetical protein KIPB_006120 [Kipferlia bialata]|uniref:Uncharacterized protein n=1 Tax=Kipferlia bialata TaxID=797122 RepID=A0A9K3CYY3_9EUKA|nr:hypothetical protein KIPB_006120 [Kipferlia bialata]|eukprot:g6120.t1
MLSPPAKAHLISATGEEEGRRERGNGGVVLDIEDEAQTPSVLACSGLVSTPNATSAASFTDSPISRVEPERERETEREGEREDMDTDLEFATPSVQPSLVLPSKAVAEEKQRQRERERGRGKARERARRFDIVYQVGT